MDLKHSEDYYIGILLKKVKIEEVMIKKVVSVFVDDPFSRVEEKFREFRIRHLPIVDKDEKLVGIITDRDLYRIQAPRRDEEGNWFYDKESLDTHILKHVMTKNPCRLNPYDPIAAAVLIMVEKKFGCIPIVEKDSTLCGIITQIDILKMAAQILREQ